MSKRILLGFLCLAALCPRPVMAAQGAWASADQVRARLLSAVDQTRPEQAIEGAIEIKLSEGWHTYWKMPGDAGLPARFDWSASTNIESVDVLWPVPTRKQELDFQVFGYDRDFVLPFDARVKDTGKEAILALALSIMVCKEICIPQELSLSLALPAGDKTAPAASNAQSKIIAFAKRKLPSTDNTGALRVDTAVIGPEALAISAYSARGFDAAQTEALAYSDDVYFTAPPEITIDAKDPHKAMIRLIKPDSVEDLNAALSGQNLHIYIHDGASALEHDIAF